MNPTCTAEDRPRLARNIPFPVSNKKPIICNNISLWSKSGKAFYMRAKAPIQTRQYATPMGFFHLNNFHNFITYLTLMNSSTAINRRKKLVRMSKKKKIFYDKSILFYKSHSGERLTEVSVIFSFRYSFCKHFIFANNDVYIERHDQAKCIIPRTQHGTQVVVVVKTVIHLSIRQWQDWVASCTMRLIISQ